MLTKVTAPDGTQFSTRRRFEYAVLVGPATADGFDQEATKILGSLYLKIEQARRAIANGRLEWNDSGDVWLRGWEGYGLRTDADVTMLAYFYPPGEAGETEPTPRPGTPLQVLRNHVGASITQMTQQAARWRGLREQVRIGAVAPLGGWVHMGWRRDLDSALGLMAQVRREREAWGCDVLLLANEIVPAVVP